MKRFHMNYLLYGEPGTKRERVALWLDIDEKAYFETIDGAHRFFCDDVIGPNDAYIDYFAKLYGLSNKFSMWIAEPVESWKEKAT